MSEPDCALLTSERELRDVTARLLADGKAVGFDIETGYEGPTREEAQLHPEENFIAGLSFTNSVTWSRYVPMRHDGGINLDSELVAECFWPLAEAGLLVAHGAKFELRVCSRWFGRYFPVRSCTMLEAHAEGTHRSVGLKPLTLETFGYKMVELWDLFPQGLTEKQRKCIRFSDLDQHDPQVIKYGCEDAIYALGHHLLRYEGARGYHPLTAKDHPRRFIYQLEMGVLPIVCAMEDFGLRYDWLLMRDGAARGRAFQDKLTAEISDDLSTLLGEPIRLNIASPKQVADVLYTKLGLPVKRRSHKTRNPSTDKIALKGLAAQHPVVQKIINWKQLAKLCGTYLETYEKSFSYAPDGRTHPDHLQHGVPAGRFAVSRPPYQQSPKVYHYELADGTTFAYNFRDAICCPPGYYGFGYDYSQIELRVLAGEAREEALLEAYAQGVDVHVRTAALMLSLAEDAVTDAERAIGKTMNFALSYQMGVDGLADRLGKTLAEAQELFDAYFAAYPRIKKYLDFTVSAAMKCGYVTTRFGRRVPIWDYDHEYRSRRNEAERLAGNAPIQGGAADYMKIAMIRADKAIRESGLPVHLVMNIHDALEWYVPEGIAPEEMIRVLSPAILFRHPRISDWPAMDVEWHRWNRWGTVTKLTVAADGSVTAAGKKEQDVNTDEDEVALPAVDLGALRRERDAVLPVHDSHEPAAGGGHLAVDSQPAPCPPRVVVIDVADLDSEALLGLAAFAKEKPGPHTLVLATPAGKVVVSEATGITPDDEAVITMCVGACRVHYDGVASAVAEGLSL